MCILPPWGLGGHVGGMDPSSRAGTASKNVVSGQLPVWQHWGTPLASGGLTD